jgi:DNA-binding transcriptional LysR family regulator
MLKNIIFAFCNAKNELMNITHIKYFLALADELHFWHTSEKVFITQSALSRHIKALEDELGFPLFIRDKRNVRLTESGKVMQKAWKDLILQIENVHQYALKMYEGEEGNLSIGHPGSVTHSVLPDLAKRFITSFPRLKIEFIELMTVDMEKALLNFQVDIGFRREISDNSALAVRLLATQSLFEEPFAVFVPENFPIKASFLQNLKGFDNENFILPNLEKQSLYTDTLKKIFYDSGFVPKVPFHSEFGTTILSLIRQGLGISILPISYAKGNVSGVRMIEIPYHSTIFVQWRKDDQNPILKNFITLLDTFDYKNAFQQQIVP